MDNEPMESPIAILEGMDEYESECGDCCRDHRVERACDQTVGHRHPSVHQRWNVFRSRTDEVYVFAKPPCRFADKDLDIPPVSSGVARLHYGLLQAQESILIA